MVPVTGIPILDIYPNSVVSTDSTIQGDAEVISDQGEPVISYGILWSESNNNPDINNNDGYIVYGAGLALFSYNISGLNPNSIYYIRAFAVNNNGYGYSTVISVQTSVVAPTVNNAGTQNMTFYSIELLGNVSDPGSGGQIDHHGIVYSESNPNPTIGDPDTIVTDLGSFSGAFMFPQYISGLQPSTVYYWRAYAENSYGLVGYGQVDIFMTMSANIVDIAFLNFDSSLPIVTDQVSGNSWTPVAGNNSAPNMAGVGYEFYGDADYGVQIPWYLNDIGGYPNWPAWFGSDFDNINDCVVEADILVLREPEPISEYIILPFDSRFSCNNQNYGYLPSLGIFYHVKTIRKSGGVIDYYVYDTNSSNPSVPIFVNTGVQQTTGIGYNGSGQYQLPCNKVIVPLELVTGTVPLAPSVVIQNLHIYYYI